METVVPGAPSKVLTIWGPSNHQLVHNTPGTYFLFKGVDIYEPMQKADAIVAAGFPGILFASFQGMFAVISPAIISGAFTDRLRLFPFKLFACLWIVLVYAPLGYGAVAGRLYWVPGTLLGGLWSMRRQDSLHLVPCSF